jgi:thiamine-monophosphate kinase
MSRGASLPGEFELIARHLAPLAQAEKGAFGLRDDAALVVPRAGFGLVLTADAIVEGVHFLRSDPAVSVARKALRVNLSDLAAKGARPRWYLMTTSWPSWVDENWIAEFSSGLSQDQAQFGIRLVGGDTTRTDGPLTISLTAIGEVKGRAMVSRAGARAGDDVWVTGTIGDAALGLRVARGELAGLTRKQRGLLLDRYRVPQPQVAVGLGLASLARAAVDVSDGLCGDLGHIASASGVCIDLRGFDVPVSDAARHAIATGVVCLEDLLAGGDDYEIAFTAPAEARRRIIAFGRRLGVEMSCIGSCRSEPVGVIVRDRAGAVVSLPKAGFTHF